MDIIERDEPSLDGKLAIPMFWGKVAGLTAQELRPEMFDECLTLVERYLVPEEAMCVALDMKSDAVSRATLLASARNCMKDGTSIVVLKGDDYVEDEEEEEEDEDEDGDEEGDAPHAAGDNGDGHDDGAPLEEDGNGDEQDDGTEAEAEAASEEKRDESGDGVDEVVGEEADSGGSAPRSEQRSEQSKDEQSKDEDRVVEDRVDEDRIDEDAELSSEEERRRKEKRKRRHKRRKKRRRAEEKKQLQQQQQQGQEGEEGAQQDDDDEEEEDEEDAVVEEGEQRVVAVMVARVVQRLQHMRSFSRIKVVDGDAYQKWLALRCHLQKAANLFERYDVATYYRVYHIVVHPDHRRKGVGSFLVRLAALRLAELFAGPGTVCTAVAPSRASQRLLARQGFKPHAVVNYHEWKDEQGQAVIAGAGTGNYSAVLAVFEVPARDPDQPLDVTPLVERFEEAEQGPRPVTAFPGRGLSRPPRPECPPAQEEPPFGIVASSAPRRPPSRGPAAEWQQQQQQAAAEQAAATASQGRSSLGSSPESGAGSSSRGATGSSGGSGSSGPTSSRNSSGGS